MKDEKELTIAEKFIKKKMMRFYSLFPSENHLFLKILSLSKFDCNWDENGILMDFYDKDYKGEELQLTESGFDSLRLAFAFRPPYSWNEPRKDSPFLNIPDNIEESWLWTLFYFSCWMEKLNDESMKNWIEMNISFSGMGDTYKKEHIDRYYGAYLKVRQLFNEKKISQRIRFIMNQNSQSKGYVKPLELKVGSVVRLKTGVDTAIVLTDNLKLGGAEFKFCQLSVPLEGSVYWGTNDLIVVKE